MKTDVIMKAITLAMKSRGWTTYRLSQELPTIPQRKLYRFFRGDTRSLEYVDDMLEVLDLKIVSK